MPFSSDSAPWRPKLIPAIKRVTRSLERLIIGLWAGLTAAGVSVFASAVPYIYAAEDNIRCGAHAIATLAIIVVAIGLEAILIFGMAFSVSRFMISVGRIRYLEFFMKLGCVIWFSTSVAGVLMFSNYVYIFGDLVGVGPDLPKNLNDKAACRNFLLLYRPHDLIRDYILPQMVAPKDKPNQ